VEEHEPTPRDWIVWLRAGAVALTALLLLFYTFSDSMVGTNIVVVCSIPFFGGAALFARDLASHEVAPLYTGIGYLGLVGHTLYALLG